MKKVSRRRLLTTSGAAGLAALAGARSVRAQALNIGLSPFINPATVFLANDLGYFSKMGLDIRMKVFMDGALVVAPMLSGEVEVGVMTPNAGFFNSLYRGGPFRAFLCNGQGRRGRAVTTVVVRSDHYDAGVKALPDLAQMRGKIAAVGAAGSINQYGLASALKLAGLNPVNDVQWQTSVPQPDIVKQFGQKQVDVADITYHLAYLGQNQGFCRILFSRDEILPDAEENLDLTGKGYQAGEIAFPQVLTARQTYFQSSLAYVEALVELRKTRESNDRRGADQFERGARDLTGKRHEARLRRVAPLSIYAACERGQEAA